MKLRDVVSTYRTLAGSWGKSVPLAAFDIPREQAEKIFSALDEDYQISRFFHFENREGNPFLINSFPQTHVKIDAEIESLL